MTDRPLRRGRAVAGALVLATLLAACADQHPTDPFAGLRADAAAPQGVLRPLSSAAGEGAVVGGAAEDRAPVRGFVRRAPAAGAALDGAGGAPAAPGEFTANFENADLREVVRAMLEDGLGAAYVIDPAVTGVATIRTNRPLTRAEILPTLEELLRLNEAAIIERDGVFRVLPRDAVGLAAPMLTARNAAAQGMTLRVTPLRFVDVASVREVLQSFAPVAGSLSFDAGRGLVFSVGTAAEQQTIADILDILDASAFARRSLALQPLRHGDPEEVAGEMAEVFAGSGGSAPGIRFVAVERLNAVLVIADDAGLLDEAMPILRGLDQMGGETAQLYVYPVENRRAADLAEVVGAIFGVEATTVGAPRRDPLAPGLDAETVGDDAAVEAAAGAGGLAGGLADALGGASGLGAAGEGVDGVVRIAADESSNAVIAFATASGARKVQAALRRLDRQPLQVMLQATLAEVTLNDRLEYGVRWFFESGNWSGAFSDAAAGGVGQVFPGFTAIFQTADIRVALNALDQVTDVRLLSSPTLMVMDNEVARLQVGDQVPVTTRSATSVQDPDAPIVTETEFRDTGVILTLRPRINRNGLVTLDVRQEVSDVVPSGDESNPTFSQRVVESTVAVDSGDTVAIGGLIREQGTRDRTGVPGLSRIPVVGAAFGANEFGGQRTELIVLLTPMVIRDQGDARAATDELREKLQGIYGPPAATAPLTGSRRASLADAQAGLAED
jgi:general secretion pathway protein D